jgi:hypothetical protein
MTGGCLVAEKTVPLRVAWDRENVAAGIASTSGVWLHIWLHKSSKAFIAAVASSAESPHDANGVEKTMPNPAADLN